ncbi:MAG: hypothetical protein AAFS02_05565 [Pseudomonadota bacterium]
MTTRRGALRWLGAALAIAGVAFVLRAGWGLRGDIGAMAADRGLLVAVVLGAIAYAAALGLLALGWAGLARAGDARPPRRDLVHIFAAASIAKYLPGNVFHFAGRQLLASKLGVSQRRLAAATLAESVATLLAALALAAIAIVAARHPLLGPTLLAGLAVAIAVGHRRPVTTMLGLALAFFLVSVAIVAAMAHLLNVRIELMLPILAAYLFAWAAGNVLPGAPGGLGVREAAFVSLADSFALTDAAVALTLVVAMRLVTLAGDVLFFFVGGSAGAITTTDLS